MDIADYRNFDVLITRAGEQYRAFVVDAPAGEASTLFDLPFPTFAADYLNVITQQINALEERCPTQ